ncbi:MAG: UDP-N-acetylmuramate--L-alanine ligase [Actinomycetota bacterium]
MTTAPPPSAAVDLSVPRRFHIVGVGGPGMSAVAILLARLGHAVSGSDLHESAGTATVRRYGVDVRIGHAEQNVGGADWVVYSTAVPQTNIELAAARAAGTPVVHRAEALSAITALHRSVGVAGTHGKTTTSSLLTEMLRGAGRDPSFVIGAEVLGLGTGADLGTDGTLVVEADESDGTGQSLVLESMLLTNVDVDHLDRFGSVDRIEDEFADMARRTTGTLVVCGDDPRASSVARRGGPAAVVTYGFGAGNDVTLSEPVADGGGTMFTVASRDDSADVHLPLLGRHNALNCAGAMAMASVLGVPFAASASAVSSFAGVDRRFAVRGTVRGALLIDDYAHLPAEIDATLRAARTHPGLTGRLVAVFQPNRFHRIATMAGDYAGCFSVADEVFVTDVYASGTERIEGVTGLLVADAVRTSRDGVVWAQSRDELIEQVLRVLGPGDICVSMGCGDIALFPDELQGAA